MIYSFLPYNVSFIHLILGVVNRRILNTISRMYWRGSFCKAEEGGYNLTVEFQFCCQHISLTRHQITGRVYYHHYPAQPHLSSFYL